MGRLSLKTGLLLRLWILAIPLGLTLLGASLNQAVIVANHGKFPVMENSKWTANDDPDANGMTDELHCIMTPDTHLNYLADVFNVGDAIVSPGDLLIDLGESLWGPAKYLWLLLLIQDRLKMV